MNGPTRREILPTLEDIQWRTKLPDGSSDYIQMTGHAAVFNRLSDPLHDLWGGFRERIQPGAFERVLAKNPDVRLLIDHEPKTVLARTPDTLKMRETEQGLGVWARMPSDLRDAQDVRVRMQHNLLTQMSFGFVIGDQDETGTHDDGLPIRTIRDVSELFDVSIVTYPAYPDTEAALRMRIPDMEYRRDFSTAERVELAKKGHAIPVRNDAGEIVDGRYPIETVEDLQNAVKDYNRTSGKGLDRDVVKNHIKVQAHRLHAMDALPEDWRSTTGYNLDSTHQPDGAGRADNASTTPEAAGSKAVAHAVDVVRLKAAARRYTVLFPLP